MRESIRGHAVQILAVSTAKEPGIAADSADSGPYSLFKAVRRRTLPVSEALLRPPWER